MSDLPPGATPVLDHGFVAPILQPDSDLKVVNAARVSFHKESHWQCGCGGTPIDEPCCHQPGDYRLSDKDAGLIRYLAAHKHWTPFAHIRLLIPLNRESFECRAGDLINEGGYEVESLGEEGVAISVSLAHVQRESMWYPYFAHCPVSRSAFWPHPSGGAGPHLPWSVAPHLTPATLHIKLPIFVDRQLVTHKVGFVRNEVSRRYVDEPPEFHRPEAWRPRPDKSIKQGSGVGTVPEPKHPVMTVGAEGQLLYTEQSFSPTAHMAGCVSMYNYAVHQAGVAPEQARIVLPVATYTEHWTTASLRSWARLFHLRSDPHAQFEIQQYAKAIDAQLCIMHPEHWPRVRDTR